MDPARLVDNYIAAWNSGDVSAVLEILHPGASYYDAFWMETCVGKDLGPYLRDTFADERYHYKRLGDVIPVASGVVFRYSTHELSDSGTGEEVYQGAEVLTLVEERIVAVSDYYCNPTRVALEEVATLAAKRHGQTRYAESGLGECRTARYREHVATLVGREKVYRDPGLTLSQLADLIGCPAEHLALVLQREFKTDFPTLLKRSRTEFAKDLIRENSGNPDYLTHVAYSAGFRSVHEFRNSFREILGKDPEHYLSGDSSDSRSGRNRTAH